MDGSKTGGEKKGLKTRVRRVCVAEVVVAVSSVVKPKASHRDSLDLLRRLGMQSDSPTSEEEVSLIYFIGALIHSFLRSRG